MSIRHYVPLSGSPDWAAGVVANRKLMLGEQRRNMGNASFRNEGEVGKVWVDGKSARMLLFGTGSLQYIPLFFDTSIDNDLIEVSKYSQSGWLDCYVKAAKKVVYSDGYNFLKYLMSFGMNPHSRQIGLSNIGIDGYTGIGDNLGSNPDILMCDGKVICQTFKTINAVSGGTYLLSDKASVMDWDDYITVLSTGSTPSNQTIIDIPMGMQAALIRKKAIVALSGGIAYGVSEGQSICESSPYVPQINGMYLINDSFQHMSVSNSIYVISKTAEYVIEKVNSEFTYTPWGGEFPANSVSQTGWIRDALGAYSAICVKDTTVLPVYYGDYYGDYISRIVGAGNAELSVKYSVTLDETTVNINGISNLDILSPGYNDAGSLVPYSLFKDTIAPVFLNGAYDNQYAFFKDLLTPAPLFCCDAASDAFVGVESCLNDVNDINDYCVVIDTSNNSVVKYNVSSVPASSISVPISSVYNNYGSVYLSESQTSIAYFNNLVQSMRDRLLYKEYIKNENNDPVEISDNRAMLILASLELSYPDNKKRGVIVLL